MAKKLKLSFVNKGKEFELPRMTVKKQEIVMEKLADIEKKSMSPDRYNSELGKIALLSALQEVDEKVTMDNIENMHPDDFTFLFNTMWNTGRELTKSDVENFHRKK